MSGRVSPTDSVASGRTSKLSKEFYIELAAFSDSIYDRGKKSIFKNTSKQVFLTSLDNYLRAIVNDIFEQI